MSRPSTLLKRWATALDEDRAYNAVLAFSKPVSAPIGNTPSIVCESIISPVGATTKMAMETFPPCPFVHSTHESTMALAASALMTILFNVRFAASAETVTFESGAGVAP